jgi:hypothetical protein
MLVVSCVAAALLGACGGAGEPGPADAPTGAATEAPSPAPDGVATGQVARGHSLTSSDGRLEITGTGSAAVEVTVHELRSGAPEPPRGWDLSSPVYQVTASHGGEAVSRLTDPLELRLKTDAPLGTVMYFDGTAWTILRSDLADGVAVAETEHLSRFALLSPSNVRAAPPIPSATPTSSEAIAGSPSATATVTAVSPEVAAAVVEAAIKKWRGEAATATGPGANDGQAAIDLPVPLDTTLITAIALGDLYSAVYDGVNQAFVSAESEGGTFTLLIEPKLEFPSSSSQAQRMLAEYFPGATGTLFVPVTQAATMYTYQASNSNGFIVLGFIEHEGVALAFVSVGSAKYVGAAVESKD